MLFLYRVQNDPFETLSFNAMELDEPTLGAFTRSIMQVFASSAQFSQEFALRIRKADPKFGYVWKDVVYETEYEQQLEGDTVLLRLIRLKTLELSNTRIPTRLVMSTPPAFTPSATAKPVAFKPAPVAEKRQQAVQPLAQPTKKPVPAPEDDGLTTEERAQRRIDERNRQEEADQHRKVEEMRNAQQATANQADARDSAWQQLRPQLEKWSNNPTGGDKKPIRALLSTLHTVLWEGSRWTPSALIVRPNEVRLAFRKAMLVVHPDKVATNAPANVQVIAKYCFECLNTAYDKFEQTELK